MLRLYARDSFIKNCGGAVWVNRSLGTAAVMLTLRLPRWSATYLGPQVDAEAQSYWGQGWFALLGQLQEAAHPAEPAAVRYPRTNPRLRGTLAAAR